MLGVDRGGAVFSSERQQALGKMHALALDVGAGLFPQLQRLGVVAEIDADLFQHRVGIALDQRQAFLVQELGSVILRWM